MSYEAVKVSSGLQGAGTFGNTIRENFDNLPLEAAPTGVNVVISSTVNPDGAITPVAFFNIHPPAVITQSNAPFSWVTATQVGNIPNVPTLVTNLNGTLTYTAGDGSAPSIVGHAAVTVTDTTSVDLTLIGQDIQAVVIHKPTGGTQNTATGVALNVDALPVYVPSATTVNSIVVSTAADPDGSIAAPVDFPCAADWNRVNEAIHSVSYTLSAYDPEIQLIDTTGGNVVVTIDMTTFSTAQTANCDKSFRFNFKKTDATANTITLSPNGGGLIDNAASYTYNGVLGSAGENIEVVVNGLTNLVWII